MNNLPKYYYVYIITNKILNKCYIGSKMCYKDDPNNDGYWGSSKYLNEEYKIYGFDNFKKEILEYYNDKNSMLNGEGNFILKYKTLTPNGYNRYLPNTKLGFHMGGCKHKEESKQKTRNSLLGVKHTEERKKHESESHLGQPAWNKGKKCECTANERNGMYGISVYDLWVKKYGKEEADRRKELRKIKLSNSLKGKNTKKLVVL
jgi:hypothetical protein